MYNVALTESHFAAQQDDVILALTVGGGLRAQALETPDAPALIETDAAGGFKRRWTYAELLADAERLDSRDPGGRCVQSAFRHQPPGQQSPGWLTRAGQ